MRTAGSCPQPQDSARELGKRAHPVEGLHTTTVSALTSAPAYPNPSSLSTSGNLAMPSALPTIRLLLVEGVKAVVLEACG